MDSQERLDKLLQAINTVERELLQALKLYDDREENLLPDDEHAIVSLVGKSYMEIIYAKFDLQAKLLKDWWKHEKAAGN